MATHSEEEASTAGRAGTAGEVELVNRTRTRCEWRRQPGQRRDKRRRSGSYLPSQGRSETERDCGASAYQGPTMSRRGRRTRRLVEREATNESPPATRRRARCPPFPSDDSDDPKPLLSSLHIRSLIRRRVSPWQNDHATLPIHYFPVVSASLNASGAG